MRGEGGGGGLGRTGRSNASGSIIPGIRNRTPSGVPQALPFSAQSKGDKDDTAFVLKRCSYPNKQRWKEIAWYKKNFKK